MDANRFDRLTRTFAHVLSRRRLAAAAVGLAATGALQVADARNKKKKREKLDRNTFGCVNVGGKCRGRDNVCCSGICDGKKPKKGKKDKSTCVAHNVLDCPPGAGACPGEVECGTSGLCLQTTGRASFCAGEGLCAACKKDADCGPGNACIVCTGDCEETGGTLCAFAAGA